MFEPTENQKRILETRNKNILVSASAGTGKTTVMIEKIAGLIIEKEASLKQVLVVTFTEMAAYEMKKRLAAKLAEKGDEDVLNQLGQIDACAISTLHGFCSNLVRRYFVEADVDPNFSILDDDERDIAFDETMSELFEDLYNAGDENFLLLVEIFGRGRRDGGLKDVVKRLYDFKVCKANFDDWFCSVKEKYAVTNGENFFTRYYNERIVSCFDEVRRELCDLLASAKEWGPQQTLEQVAALADSIHVERGASTEENVRALKAIGPLRAYSPRKLENFTPEQIDNTVRHKAVCAKIKDCLAENDLLAAQSFEELSDNMATSFKCVEDLFALVKQFEDAFEKFKKQNALLDFNDLEHKALQALSFDRVRDEIKNNYKFVFVDEYQDINEIQEQILSLVKSLNNLFLVGDVKQSIYGFRQCAPDIFVGKIDSFGSNAKLNHLEFLNDNYRSHSAILNFVNEVFMRCMSADKGIDYKNTSMFSGNSKVTSALPAVRVDVVRCQSEEVVPQTPYSVHDLPTVQFGGAQAEAQIVAKRIRELIGLKITTKEGTRTLSYSDIVILTRGFAAHANRMTEELQALGIPLIYAAGDDLFSAAEFNQLLNFLRVLDNERQDIPLFGCLTGWFCGMDENMLADVCLDSDGDLWDKATAYVAAHCDEAAQKLRAFFALREKFAFFARSMTVSRLIAKIFDETDLGLWILGLPDGDLRLKRLNAFSDGLQGKAHNGSLCDFLRHVDALDKLETECAASSQTNAVRIMTIHKSKGLEFPVVFVINCGGRFNLGNKESVVCDREGGAACMAYDLARRTCSDTLSRKYVREMAVAKEIEEEKRLLYVAMTRAKYHLYLTGSADPGKTFDKNNCYFDWVIPAIKAMGAEKSAEVVFEDAECQQEEKERQRERKIADWGYDQAEVDRIKKDLQWRYPHEVATTLELKAVSSALQPHFEPQGEEDDFVPRVLRLDDVPQDGVEANVLGTGYHKVFEKIDFSVKTLENVTNTIARLRDEGEIAAEVAEKIDPKLVLGVLNEKIFDGLSDKKVYRELPFMLKTQYNNVFDDKRVDENIFLQGVLDMLIIDGDQATVVDYKYTRNPAAVKQRYQKQLDSYAQAVRQILKIEKVRKFVLSVADGSVIEL